MKKFAFLLVLLPAALLGQTCQPYAEINGHSATSEISRTELSSLSKLIVGGTCHGEKYYVLTYEFTMMRRGSTAVIIWFWI